MSGWLTLLALIAAGLGALWLLGLRGALLQVAAAALLFGAAGYAVQGRPGLPAAAPQASAQEPGIPLTRLRQAFFGSFSGSEHWQLIADSYTRRGAKDKAVGVLRSAVREHPRDPALWIGLGNALVDHAGMLTPAAEFAYATAAELAPDHPAPRFFLGLALARSGDGAGALAQWRIVLADAPADAGWRPLVEDAVAALTPPPSATN